MSFLVKLMGTMAKYFPVLLSLLKSFIFMLPHKSEYAFSFAMCVFGGATMVENRTMTMMIPANTYWNIDVFCLESDLWRNIVQDPNFGNLSCFSRKELTFSIRYLLAL